MPSRRLAVLVLATLLVACDGQSPHPTDPDLDPQAARLPGPPDLSGIPTATAFAQTVTHQGPDATVVDLPLDDVDWESFSAPFILHVSRQGDVSAQVHFTGPGGETVLWHSQLSADFQESDEPAYVVPVGPGTTITLRLKGSAGATVTLRLEAPVRTAPRISITSPARGAVLVQGTFLPTIIEVTGEACDAQSPIVELVVLGVSVPVSGTNLCEPFTITHASRWGMTHLTGYARNANGMTGTVVQSYIRGPAYFPVTDHFEAAGRAEHALAIHLNDLAIDDGDRTSIDDLATIVQLSMDATDLDLVLPSTMYGCETYDYLGLADFAHRVVRGAFDYEDLFVVGLEATPGALSTIVRLNEPETHLIGQLFAGASCSGGAALSVHGAVGAAFLHESFDVAASVQGGEVEVGDPASSVTISGAYVDFPSASHPLLGNVADLFVDALGPSFIGVYRNALEAMLDEHHRVVMEDVLRELTEDEIRDVTIGGTSFRVRWGLHTLEFDERSGAGSMRVGYFAQTIPLTAATPAHQPIGALRGQQTPATFSLFAYDFGTSLHQDLVNQALWAAWRAGAFDVADASSLPGVTPVSVTSLSLRSMLPPVSMATSIGDPMVLLGWGDVHVLATVDPADFGGAGDPVTVEAWVGGLIDGDLRFDESTQRLALDGDVLRLFIQLVDPMPGLDAGALADAIAADLEQPLLALSAQTIGSLPVAGVRFTHPAFPAGSYLSVNDVAVSRNGFHYLVTGSLDEP